MLRRLIGEDIELVWRSNPRLWPVMMDPSQLDQILANLSVNSRDAIEGVGTLTIETDNVTFNEKDAGRDTICEPGEYVMLSVSDTGIGMSQEVQAHLFEPFFSTKEVGKGTGLGLATVYGIVKQNSGFIEVQSEQKKGTAVRIYLPRALAEETSEAPVAENKSPRGTETVLIVEDEEAVLILVKVILERHGYTVFATRKPEDALALAETCKDSIHLLITDVIMPSMNGRVLEQRIRRVLPDIKVLFISGYTANVIAQHGVLKEGIHFLQKPFSNSDLTRKVRRVLDQKS
ncbi:MAG TPA: ATP-binding protein [bacterium]|nr:ATP-binding protein [bacterium]